MVITSDKEIIRIRETLAMIPSDVKSILNVGCGDGRVTNSISGKYALTGVDINKERVKSCLGTKMIADISKLPFENSTFDLVMATEVLEHLRENTYLQGIKEIIRVAKKFILITVPFKEPLAAQWAKCSKCDHVFHAWGHLRRFDLKSIDNLFSSAYVQKKVLLSPKEEKIPNWLHIFVRTMGSTWNCNKKNDLKCPECGAQQINTCGNMLCWFLNRVIWRLQKVWFFQKPIWISALYLKK